MCLHFTGKVVGCHQEAFVTSDQKESRKKTPSKLQNAALVTQADQHSPILKGKHKIYPYMSQGFGSIEAWSFAMGQPHLPLTSFSAMVQEIIPLGNGNSQCQPTSWPGADDAGTRGRNSSCSELQHWAPKARPVQARPPELQKCL